MNEIINQIAKNHGVTPQEVERYPRSSVDCNAEPRGSRVLE